MSRTSGARVWPWCLSSKVRTDLSHKHGVHLAVGGIPSNTFEAPCSGGTSWVEPRKINLLFPPLLSPDKTSVPASACLREAPFGASLWLWAHQPHWMPPCTLAGYDNVASSHKPDLVCGMTTFKAHGNRVICLFNINKQIREGERRNEISLAEMAQVLSNRGMWEGMCLHPCWSCRNSTWNSSTAVEHFPPLSSTGDFQRGLFFPLSNLVLSIGVSWLSFWSMQHQAAVTVIYTSTTVAITWASNVGFQFWVDL